MFNGLLDCPADKNSRFLRRFYLETLILFLLLLQISQAQGSWSKIGDIPFDRYGHTIDELNGKLYVVGGGDFEGGTFPATALVYDTSSQQWSQISLYNDTQRNNHNSCIVDGKLYVVGGNDGVRTTATMEMYDPQTDEWISKAPMPTDRAIAACVLYNNKIFVIGGIRGALPWSFDWGGTNQVEAYDIKAETWMKLSEMPTKRWGHSVVVYNDKIYVFGGRSSGNPYSNIEVYEPETDTWNTISQLTPMPTPRYCLTTCLFNYKIYAIGGWFNSASGPIYDKVEVYNPESDMWQKEPSIPIPICAPSIVLGDRIYLYGGTYTTHPNFGTSAIYELSYGNVFAQKSYVDKSFARKDTDSILFNTSFSNRKNLLFKSHLICISSDSTQIDSLILFDDGLHEDSLINDGLYGAFISPRSNEDFYSLNVSTIESQTLTYSKMIDVSKFTTLGPVKLDSILIIHGLADQYFIRPYVHNLGEVKPINNAKLKIICSDKWIASINQTYVNVPNVAPNSSVAIPTLIFIKVIDSLFSGYFNLKAEIKIDGWTYWEDSLRVNTITNIDEEKILVNELMLSQNYPNPFNPSTKISWQTPIRSHQILKVFDVLGREVKTLVNEEKEAGYHSIDFNASDLPSGVYFYDLKAGSYIESKKMILLK